jgi:hypothetical protein
MAHKMCSQLEDLTGNGPSSGQERLTGEVIIIASAFREAIFLNPCNHVITFGNVF